jgi:hypothetical protein
MNWLSSNWIWLAFGVGALVLFASGRGGCGMGHSGHDHRRRGEGDQYDRPRDTIAAPLSTPTSRFGSDDNALPSTGYVHGAPSANQGALSAEHAGHDTDPSQVRRQRHRHGC